MNKDWLKLATFALSKCKSDKNPLLTDNSEKPVSHTNNNELDTKEKPNVSFSKPQELAEKKGGSPFWLENNQKMNSDPTVGEEAIDRKKIQPKTLREKIAQIVNNRDISPEELSSKIFEIITNYRRQNNYFEVLLCLPIDNFTSTDNFSTD